MTTGNIATIRQLLQRFDFASLFIEELGRDRHNAALPVEIDGISFTLRSVAEKRGVQIFRCPPDPGGSIPERSIRQKIEIKILQVPQKDMAKAIEAMRNIGISGTVKNMGGTGRRSVSKKK